MVVEPHARQRFQLDRALAAAGAIDVLAQAADPATGRDLAARLEPQVVVIGPGIDPVEARAVTEWIGREAREARVLVLLQSPSEPTAHELLMAGAAGVLPADTSLGELPGVLASIADGEAAVTAAQLTALVERFRFAIARKHAMRPLAGPLSTREWEVLDIMRTNASSEEAATLLGVKRATVYSHLRNISRKLGVKNRGEALRAAERLRGRGAR